jgi:hypothetical protein
MPESLLAVVRALVLAFGIAVGVLRLMGPAENQVSRRLLKGQISRPCRC